jgi:hypothetical protein
VGHGRDRPIGGLDRELQGCIDILQFDRGAAEAHPVNRIALALLLLCGLLPAADFSIVFIPDVHLNSQTNDCTWVKQTQYLNSQIATLKIAAVIGGGDFANSAANQPTHIPHAWSTTACSSPSGLGGMTLIDTAALPWLIAVGNHDYDSDSPSGRVTALFDTEIGYGRISGKSWYVGYYSSPTDTKANQAIRFVTNGRTFLVIALEFFPRAGAITWADSVIATYPNDETIVITHGYMQSDGSLATQGSQYGPQLLYGLPSGDYDGTEIEAWAATHPSIRAVMCGHWIGGVKHSHRTDTHTSGSNLYGTFTNYQDAVPASNTVTLLEFTTATATVTVSQLNTTTGAIDNTTYVPYDLSWASSTGLFPLPSPLAR